MNAVTPAMADQLANSTALSTPAPFHPDADLIATCHAMIAAQLDFNAIYDGPNAIKDDSAAEEAAAPLRAQWGILLDKMQRLRATGAGGIAARAQALAVHAQEGAFSFDDPETMTGRMLDCLLRDAAALSLQPTAPDTDADLIARCEAYMEAVVAFNADPCDIEELDDEGNPASRAMSEAEDAAAGLRATTLAGLIAKAKVATFLAGCPNGVVNYSDSITGSWPAQVVQDLLAMPGSVPPPPPPGDDAELVAMAAEARPLIRSYETTTAAYRALPSGDTDLLRIADLGTEPSQRLDDMFDRAKLLPATTVAGWKAKALLLQQELTTSGRIEGEIVLVTPAEEMAWSLVQDMIGERFQPSAAAVQAVLQGGGAPA